MNKGNSSNSKFLILTLLGSISLTFVIIYLFGIADFSSKTQFLDNNSTPNSAIYPSSAVSGKIFITVDASAEGRPISPYIYGIAHGTPDYMRKLGVTTNRWGGNPSTRYNWEVGNAWNAARDYLFANTDYDSKDANKRQPSGGADAFVRSAKEVGAGTILTVPALGYVAKNSDLKTRSTGVPEQGQPSINPNGAIKNYDPTANRNLTSVPIFPTKSGPLVYPPDLTDNAVYADEWIAHLIQRFGTAAEGGVNFYSVDNEPDLWADTHTDVHPALPTYDELLQKFTDYATMIRKQDPTAKIIGPVLSTSDHIDTSPLDRATRNSDRKAHDNKPFLEWWLAGVKAHDDKLGKRTLDVLDVHYYPPGDLFASKKKLASEQRNERLASTSMLWDNNYTRRNYNQALALIPRMRGIVDRNYPGTQLGITEWNLGGEKDISGALAVADTLGIFGEQNLYLASYWTLPPENSPAYFAFKMFCNYDGSGGRFGNLSVPASSSSREQVAVYAARQSSTNDLTLIAINKTPETQHAHFDLKNQLLNNKSLKMWQYAESDESGIKPQSPLTITNSGFDYSLPGYSITLLKVDNGNTSN